eukprot:6181182-Prymnesium_polylepis.2
MAAAHGCCTTPSAHVLCCPWQTGALSRCAGALAASRDVACCGRSAEQGQPHADVVRAHGRLHDSTRPFGELHPQDR